MAQGVDGNDDAQQSNDKRIADAIKRVYFYSKKERTIMRQNAAVVMDMYMDDNPSKIQEMKHFYIDCRNTNYCDCDCFEPAGIAAAAAAAKATPPWPLPSPRSGVKP
jgi:hypothetical protein